jgi:hypothetical protein
MFREMRRNKQLLSMEDTISVMDRCTNGVIACLGDDDYPYAVPVSYVYFNEKIYFHSAKAGHKIDAVAKNPKVSFAVIDEDTIVSKEYTSYFRSVIAFGKARIAEGDERIRQSKKQIMCIKKDGSLVDSKYVVFCTGTKCGRNNILGCC